MADRVTISVDALGGDNAPGVVLEGVEAALADDADLEVILCGPAEVVEPFAADHDRCSARATTEVIGMAEHPANAVRKKKDSSIVVGCRLVKEGEAQGFFSAGSTGACLAAGTLVIGRIKGVSRPALATILPSPKKPVVLCDVGANADCKPEYLVQFAIMASAYATKIIGVKNPTVGLLNIGEEEEKGSQFAQEAHALLKQSSLNFKGNAEGRDTLKGEFDVIVCDGFTGNVCLKTIEGTASVLLGELKTILKSSLKTKLAALAIKGGLKDLLGRLDPDVAGGAPLLGVKGACIVGHGSSNARAIKNGVLASASYVRSGVSEVIAQTIQ
ncbi:MAG: phosphate acyltransferase PlsX [Eggerthellaceae bacterium]|nr:phosphate acyltransferase PlsX [Eggerthellaceae bacterium]